MTNKTSSKQKAVLKRAQQSSINYSARYGQAFAAAQRNVQAQDRSSASEQLEFTGIIHTHKPSRSANSVVLLATPGSSNVSAQPLALSPSQLDAQPGLPVHTPSCQPLDPKTHAPPIPRKPELHSRIPSSRRPNSVLSALKTQQRQAVDQAARWLAYVEAEATYHVNVRVEDLQNRSDDEASFEQAVIAAEALRSSSIPAQSTSGRWVDVNGKPLVAYFGEREFDGRVVCDGITERMMARKHYCTQMLFHEQPKPVHQAKTSDQRHDKDSGFMEYFAAHETQPNYETQGLRHDCLWSARGNPQMGLVPSKDLHSTATGMRTTQALLYADDDITGLLREMTKVAFPDEFRALESSFAAGSWISKPLPNGPGGFKFPLPGGIFLGRATLWKLQTCLHIDKEDFLCAITNSGSFDGGEAILPDLNKKLSYRPRHVIIFRSACLYHEVKEWTPKVMARNDYFTPGRVAYVYFTHSNAVEMLEGKPPGWYEKTACGNFDTGAPIIP